MNIGIVGSEAAKFTSETEQLARRAIRRLIDDTQVELVISGHSPLGGIDLWAVDEADRLCIPTMEYAPRNLRWSGDGGYQERNLQIARASDKVVCITVKQLPPDYHGMRFRLGCYHCCTPPEHHVKSGGCWTMKQAHRMGKDIELVVIDG